MTKKEKDSAIEFVNKIYGKWMYAQKIDRNGKTQAIEFSSFCRLMAMLKEMGHMVVLNENGKWEWETER